MPTRPVPLVLAEAIRALLEASGATHSEQFGALAIARELIPFSENSPTASEADRLEASRDPPASS